MKESNYNVWVEHDESWYVFNGVSGALLCLSQEEYSSFRQYMAGDEEVACSVELLEKLAYGRVFIPDSADEVAFLEDRYKTSRGETDNFTLTIVTSLGCNFDCPYCFEAKHASIIDAQVERYILDILDAQLPHIQTFNVTWFGGEPLVGKKPLLRLSDAFIDRCAQFKVQYSANILTNGYLLDENTCIELRDRQVIAAQIGLDGPPSIHNQLRPLAGGQGSFWRIVENIHNAIKYMDVCIRVNIDKGNIGAAEELMQILANESLAGKVTLYPGQIIRPGDEAGSPFKPYAGSCFSKPGFAQAELEFGLLAQRYGFSKPSLPKPSGAPCTAVRANELVVGSAGELYKCWNSVGHTMEVIGHIRDYGNPNGRLQKWLKYDPFQNSECQTCIALPVCMGGCASHAMTPGQYENRCGTFRHTYRETIQNFINGRHNLGLSAIVSPQTLVRQIETR
jgi:uncharacterized protein